MSPATIATSTPGSALRWEAARTALVRPAQVATGSGGVLLLVAIQHFHAGPSVKALVAGASFMGLLASPLVVSSVARRGWSASGALAALLSMAGAALIVASANPRAGTFFVGVLIGAPLIMAVSPLVTAVWRQIVSDGWRGRRFSQVNLLAGVAGIASTAAISLWMAGDAGRYRPVVFALGALLVAAAAASRRIPSRPIRDHGRSPLHVLALLWQRPMFGLLNVAWTLLGLGNLITVPLRTEYLASAEHGLAYAPNHVLLLTIVVPQVGWLVSAVVWGRLYDRVNFLVLRVALNGLFIASILAFFSPSPAGQALGAFLYGMAEGGGTVVWSLWVMRYAPPERTADYMAVHTFLTGVRGLAAPLIAYTLLEPLALAGVTSIGVGLLAASCLLIVVLMPFDRPAEALT